MKKLVTKSLIAVLGLAIISCGANDKLEQDNVEIVQLQEQKLASDSKNKLFVAKVSEEKGASLYFNIENPSFETKANSNGTVAKTVADISNYIVYLVKNNTTTAYPLNGDPLGTDRIAGPFTIANTGTPASKTVRFDNVPISTPAAYYIAVRAQDSGSNDIILDNNGSGTAWTGTTATTTLKVAVSTGAGVIVDNSLAVSSTTPLPVSPRLLGATGATIEANITPSTTSGTGTITATGL